MAELKGFQPSQQSGPSSAGVAPTAQLRAGAAVTQSLVSKLESFTGVMKQQAQYEAQDQAVQDAAKASMNGEPFYKESVYTTYGRAYNNAASATYAANANIELQKKSDELQLEHENNPLAYTTTMDSFVKELSDNAPTSDLGATIKIGGTKLKNSTFGDLSVVENNRIKASQLETYEQEADINIGQIINLESKGDTAAADLLKKKNLVHMNSLVEDGVMSDELAQKYTKQGNYEIRKGTASQNMNGLLENPSLQDASTLLENYKSTISQDLDPEEHEAIYNEMNRLYNAEIGQRKADEKINTKNSDAMLKENIKILKAGRTPDNIGNVWEMRGSASDKVRDEFDLEVKAYSQSQELLGLPLAEQEAIISKRASDENANLEEVMVAQKSLANIKEKRTKIKDDPVSLAREEGIIDVETTLSIDRGVESYMNNLQVAVDNSTRIQEEYGSGAVQIMTKDEANGWAEYLSNPKTPIDEKMQFIQFTQLTSPDAAKTIFKQLDKANAPTMAFAANLSVAGNTRAAKLALLGKGADVLLPEGFEMDLKTKMAGVFEGFSSEFHNQNYKGMVDYAKGVLKDGGEIDDIFAETIGIQENYNNKKVILPQGVDSTKFESWLDNIIIEDRPGMTKGLNDMTDVLFDGDYQLHYAGQGEYYVKVNNGGNAYFARDSEDAGKPFILKYGEHK